MSLRFRRSIKIAPGVKINVNKKSASLTVGSGRVHKTFNTNGQTTTSVNLPIKGLSYTDRRSSAASSRKKQSRTSGRSSSHAASTASMKPSAVKEKKYSVRTILADPPTVGVAVFGGFLIVAGFFVSGSSIPAGIVVAALGAYLIYSYIAHRKHPDAGKYISEDQLSRWRQLLSVQSGNAYELSKKSLPVLLDLKASAEEYCSQLPGSAEALLNTQRKIVDFSEFVIIKGDNPQNDYDRYAALVTEAQE